MTQFNQTRQTDTTSEDKKKMKTVSHGKNCPCKIPSSKARTQILLPHLKNILRGKRTDKAEKIKNAPNCLIKYASDCAGALLKQHIQLPPENIKKLKKHRNALHFLAKKKPSIKKKRAKLIEQNGAGLPVILPILASAISGLISAFT
jgi:hypothetical protein